MPPLPAHCTRCGYTFLSNVHLHGITLIGGSAFEMQCPRCRGTARSLPGDFEFTHSETLVKAAPPDTVIKLEKLREALKAARAEDDLEAVIKPLTEVSPQLAILARTAASRGGMATVVALLLYMLASCSQNTKSTINWNQMVDQAHVYVTGDEPYPGLRTMPEPQSTGTVEEGQPSRPEARSGPSRQQRRQLERQSKKLQRQSGQRSAPTRPSLKKPKA